MLEGEFPHGDGDWRSEVRSKSAFGFCGPKSSKNFKADPDTDPDPYWSPK